ncbi:cinnamoyl-CoA reductase CAD2-like [Aristolochia californica]|uniref:cinnamoyl-CoA reductase CAD2-like n=1 Tax=Aristolochia californica TaxID=171875 RepID=UPI0035DC08A0
MSATNGAVCVTGGSGFIGSWAVRLLLERGYTVHTTVKDLNDEKETKHLKAMDFADSHLRLFEMDLLDYNSILAAVQNTVGVIHMASPNTIERVEDPERDLLGPAIDGTKNVLKAAKFCGVKRVVVTASVSGIIPSPKWPADVVKGEDCWTDIEYCKQKELLYPISKTMAEKAAYEFSKETGLEVVCVNPGTVLGPILPPVINASMAMLVRLLKGSTDVYEDFYMGCVHVKDVALAHILLYENKSASGRHLCIEAITHFSDFAAKVAELYPNYNVPSFPKDTQPGLLRARDPSKKLVNLGLKFHSMEEIIKDSVESLKSRGYIA